LSRAGVTCHLGEFRKVFDMTATPKVLNKRVDGEPDGSAYIGRGSPYGNPFVIGVHGNRDQVCDMFEALVLPGLDVEPLRGKDLVCFCKPLRCHGDAIMAKLYGETILSQGRFD
jgi:hypothetical protein